MRQPSPIREIGGCDGLASSNANAEALGAYSHTLAAECDQLQAERQALGEDPKTITLHPATLARYEAQVSALAAALDATTKAGIPNGTAAIRDLVESVTVLPNPDRPGGVEVHIKGRLTALLGERAFPEGVKGLWGSMVAEEGFEPPTHGL